MFDINTLIRDIVIRWLRNDSLRTASAIGPAADIALIAKVMTAERVSRPIERGRVVQ
jgi:hypothetical protein